MSKDNVDLICDIGEVAGLFERTRSLTDFLLVRGLTRVGVISVQDPESGPGRDRPVREPEGSTPPGRGA